MKTLRDIETAISELSRADRMALRVWLDEYEADEWDRQIERDAKAGKFERVLAEVDAEIDAGNFSPL